MIKKSNTEKHLAIISGSSVNEPKVAEESYNIDMIVALNWYGNKDYSVLRKYATEFVKTVELGECVPILEKASDIEIHYIGVLGRLLLRNQFVSDKHIDLINEKLQDISLKYTKKPTTKVIEKTKSVEKVIDLVSKYGAEIDEELDKFITTKSSTFSAKAFLEQNNINATLSKKIGGLYTNTLLELNNINTDPELTEGYNNFSKIQLRHYKNLVQSIINDCNQHAESTKVKRTVRVVKPKPLSVLVAKVQYLKEFPELKLKSVATTKLVDSSEVWLYNTVTRKVMVYYGGGKMTIKGTTLINFDVVKSVSKILRKPEEMLGELVNLNKRTINNWFATINAKPITLTSGRLNSDSIILAIF